MLVKFRMARIRWCDPVSQIITTRPVGMPKGITTVGEVDSRLANRYIHSIQLQRPQKGHLNIDIILPELVNHPWLPLWNLVFRDNLALPVELGRPAPTNPGHLSDPAGFHLVHVFIDWQPTHFCSLRPALAANQQNQTPDHYYYQRTIFCASNHVTPPLSGF